MGPSFDCPFSASQVANVVGYHFLKAGTGADGRFWRRRCVYFEIPNPSKPPIPIPGQPTTKKIHLSDTSSLQPNLQEGNLPEEERVGGDASRQYRAERAFPYKKMTCSPITLVDQTAPPIHLMPLINVKRLLQQPMSLQSSENFNLPYSFLSMIYLQSNPIARWHICQGSINGIAFSTDGTYLATVGRDGYLRVFDYSKEQLICGVKSYYGALLCCAWSMDGKYILTGGEDDLVQVWSMEDRKVVAWGEGHSSWVSGVAFDSYWSSPTSDNAGENAVYRFGSVGQDTQLLLWDLVMDEIVVPLRQCPPGGSPTFSTGNQSSHWDSACPVGTLQSAPSMQDVPKLSPLVAHRVHTEPLSGLIFTGESVLTVCREGHVKIWMRPEYTESQSSNSETMVSTSSKEKLLLSGKVGSTNYKAIASQA
ncbi:hypothetical protein HHK36_019150 [Tetracentron sinense]|uniref:Uncharacterized protein n=1 Tax=Tetracentron sinense TaxID=13715 RepID=A0A835DBZ4_TETSI|nr:hypothetical protein HHK36_019150 [Tetracentron sinense]